MPEEHITCFFFLRLSKSGFRLGASYMYIGVFWNVYSSLPCEVAALAPWFVRTRFGRCFSFVTLTNVGPLLAAFC